MRLAAIPKAGRRLDQDVAWTVFFQPLGFIRMPFAVICTYRPGGDVERFPHRIDHLRYMIAAEPFTVFGGALLTDDGQRSTGMIVVLDVPDRAAAEDFVSAEPYARAGLFENVAIRQFRQMTPALTPGFLSEELQRELASREPSSR